MPAFTPDDPSDALSGLPQPVQIHSPVAKVNIVDTSFRPEDWLLTNIEGSPWTVEYFQQVLGRDNEVAGQNVNRDAVYQQYRLIHQFEFRVTQPLVAWQDEVSKEFTYTGTANIFPVLIPNEGDMFIANVGDGRLAVFQIRNPTQLSIYKRATYRVDYEAIEILQPDRKGDLYTKIVEELYFVSDFLRHGQNPLITTQALNTMVALQDARIVSVQRYFTRYYSRNFKTLIVPDAVKVYDPFILKYIERIINSNEVAVLVDIELYNTQGFDAMQSRTLWDLLLEPKSMTLSSVPRQLRGVSPRAWNRGRHLRSVFYMRVDMVLVPQDPDYTVDMGSTYNTALTGHLQDLVVGDYPATAHVPAFQRDTYLFNEMFYQGNAPGAVTTLEALVHDLIAERKIDAKNVLMCVQDMSKWVPIQEFYYAPIMWLLIDTALRGL